METDQSQALSKEAWDASQNLGHGGSRQANKAAAALHHEAAQSNLALGNANAYASHRGQEKHHNYRATKGL